VCHRADPLYNGCALANEFGQIAGSGNRRGDRL
jgi:hypothetical protein